MRRLLFPCVAATGLLIASALPAGAQTSDYGLPQLGSAGGGAETQREYRLGRAWLRQFRAQAPTWQDPISQQYVESLVNRLLPHSDMGNIQPLVTLVDSRLLNAFAVPGGIIGVNSGLFSFAKSEDAFASVLAHELGHLSQRHHARQQQRAEETQLPTMAALLAGMLIAAGGGGQAGIATAMGSQAAFLQDQLAYSRRYEQEADRVGLQALAEAGFDPNAMVEMFRSMQRMASLQGGNPPEFLLTHPVTQSRISDTESRASQLTPAERRDAGPQYDMIRARALLDLHRNDPSQATTRLAQDSPSEEAQRYLDALVNAERDNLQQALESLDQLAAELPDLTMIRASAVELALDTGEHEEARDRAQRLLRLFPGHTPTQMFLAEALLQSNPERAYDLLRDLADKRPNDPQVFILLAEAAGDTGRNGWGHLARAEELQLTGRIDRAIRQLDIAEDIANQEGESSLSQRIEQRRDEFMEYREAMEQF
ncbi:M48 family metalloprotease [Aidingimonas halophila]|uniref:Putative beta-barrel assembly-enhancing protease n=1 Tax=Aidingimonas halophila TaxID=574349 RepID=A0A1H2URI0_9GAMM|nr:M48 family metalloprotease [Aidingimonas halophila]GHC23076.1 putative beta-barrel assembly-enhancing protease [Aidingimonas halophila]SDW58727.1 Putative Zn-dependent protease, contains TPR repeats [Aidingimonas halophila]